MAKREKKLKAEKFNHEEEEEEEQVKQSKPPPIFLSDDEDEVANEDLSLKIVEKARSRASKNDGVVGESKNEVVIDLTSLASPEAVTDLKENKKKGRKKKRDTVETREEAVDVAKEEEDKAMTEKAVEDKFEEKNPVQIADNSVLRKLLRGPRYFDPPDSSWGACYNCGEQGHTAANCTSLKWNKPCFVCGSLEHKGRQCTKGQDCFICKKGGHRAKNCPEKYRAGSQNDKVCLKCGDFGHDMFTCENDYSPDDLQEIQCYICKSFGHLSCAYSNHSHSREVSCYRCGQLGHTGLACVMSRGETTTGSLLSQCYKCGEEGHFARECAGSAKRYAAPHGETTSGRSPSSCYKCGGEGHFARECPSSATKVRKRNRELSTPTRRYPKENGDYFGVRSVPHDLGKASKRKKPQYEGAFAMSPKPKHRGGWITEDPGDLPYRKPNMSRWRSPSTPNNKMNNISSFHNSSHASSSQSFKTPQHLHFGTPTLNGSANSYQHRFSTPRFGNSSSDGMRRNYDW